MNSTDTKKLHSALEQLSSLLTSLKADGLDELEALESAATQLSEQHVWFNQFTKWNQQVLQNGILGYFENGYHSTEQSGHSLQLSASDDLHQHLIETTKSMLSTLSCTTELKTLLKTLLEARLELDEDEFDVIPCHHCSNGEITSYDEDGEEISEDCPHCEGGESQEYNERYLRPTDECRASLQKAQSEYFEVSAALVSTFQSEVLKTL